MEPSEAFTRIEAMVPAEWQEGDAKSVFLVIYEVQGMPSSDLAPPLACELKNVCAFVVNGAISHRENVEVTQFFVDAKGLLNVVHPELTEMVRTPLGLYLIFASPFTETVGTNAGQLIAETQVEIAVGLFGSFQGRNVIFRRISENKYSFARREASSWSAPVPVPITLPPPTLSPEGLRPILKAEKARWELPDAVRNRVELSLRWIGYAISQMTGVDAFLKYWLAIETLGMPTDSDIRPLNAALAEIYGYASPSLAKVTFHTGLLYGLRCRIVHDGVLVAIDSRILRHCENLYHDLLVHTLGQPTQGRVAAQGVDQLGEIGALLRYALSAQPGGETS